jgi:hypothetical protein
MMMDEKLCHDEGSLLAARSIVRRLANSLVDETLASSRVTREQVF